MQGGRNYLYMGVFSLIKKREEVSYKTCSRLKSNELTFKLESTDVFFYYKRYL